MPDFWWKIILRKSSFAIWLHANSHWWDGSFRFHFSLKDRCGLGIERLTSDKDYLKKSFYEAFPAIGDSLDRLVNPSIETLTNEHETHMCDESETSEHISNLTNALHENIIFDCCSCLKWTVMSLISCN